MKAQQEGTKLKEDDNDEDEEGHRERGSTVLSPMEKLCVDLTVAQTFSATTGLANPPGQTPEIRPTLPGTPLRPTLVRVILSMIYSSAAVLRFC